VPVGCEYRGRDYGSGEASDLCAVPTGGGRSSAGECGGAGAIGCGGGGRGVEARRSVAGGDDCGFAGGLFSAGANERGGAGVGASECGAGYCGDGGASGGDREYSEECRDDTLTSLRSQRSDRGPLTA